MSNLAKQPTSIRQFLAGEKFKEQLALALPSHMTPDRFVRIALTTMTKIPKLADCSQESILSCLMTCSQLGLEPDGRHAHLIPYGNECQIIIDWKGLVALARRSGDVAVWKAELVCEKDGFEWSNGIVKHTVDWRQDRGKMQAVYSYVKFKDGNEDFEVMTLEEVNKIRERSKSKNSGPWVTDFPEMAKKTALRRHSKRLTLSPEFADALEKDFDQLPERNVTPKGVGVPVLEIAPVAEPAPEKLKIEKPKKESPLQKWLAETGLDEDRVRKYADEEVWDVENLTDDQKGQIVADLS